MEQDRKGKIYRKLFVGFFAVMLVCTVISRIYDSVTVPKVVTERMKQKPVDTVVYGSGTIREKETVSLDIYPGIKVESVPVIPGTVVKSGDVIASYQLESLLEAKADCAGELEKLNLELESQKVSAEVYPDVSQSELAAFEVQMAERELLKGQQEYTEAQAEHDAELLRLKEDYDRKSVLTQDELWEQQNQQYEAARKSLAQSRRSRDSEVRTATRKVDDLEKKIGGLTEEGGHDEEVAQLERELARAREDLDDLIDSWDEEVEDQEYEVDRIDNQQGRIEAGKTTSLEALKESYDAAVKQQEEKLKNAKKELENLETALEKARFSAGNAAKSDENTRLTNIQKQRLSDLTQKGLLLDIEKKQRELARLEELIGKDGIVEAETDGTVVKQELVAGKKTTGEELVTIAAGALQFEGSFVKEEQELAVGDVLSIGVPGTSRKIEAKIDRLNLLGESDGIFQADIEELAGSLGAVTSYECKKQSDTFRQVIPLGALRKDMKGYYCLAARARSAILGEEFRAERVDVQLLSKGSTEAAIEGPIFEEDDIIVKSNQVIGEGDRVRKVPGL